MVDLPKERQCPQSGRDSSCHLEFVSASKGRTFSLMFFSAIEEARYRATRTMFAATTLCSFALLGGYPISSVRAEKYEIVNTGIEASGCWYDSTRFVILQGRQIEGSSAFAATGIFFFDVTKPIQPQRVDLQPIEVGMQQKINKIFCKDRMILFNLPGSLPVDPGVTKLYAVQIGKPSELIAEMRGLYPASKSLSVTGRYVVGNNRRMASGVFDGREDCALIYHKPDFRALCWDTYSRNLWPLSRFVLAEYRWEETIRVIGEDGKPKTISNPEAPLLGKGGEVILSALLLRDFSHRILVNLSESSRFAAFALNLVISPDERYAYTTCRKLDLPHRGPDRVCRYMLDGTPHHWEEVFAFDPERREKVIVIRDLSVSSEGDVYFIIAGARGNNTGIWKYDRNAKKLTRITNPPAFHDDAFPQVSPDGKRVAFIRPVDGKSRLFLRRAKG